MFNCTHFSPQHILSLQHFDDFSVQKLDTNICLYPGTYTMVLFVAKYIGISNCWVN